MATAHEDLGYALYVHEYSTGNFDEARYHTLTIVVFFLFSLIFHANQTLCFMHKHVLDSFSIFFQHYCYTPVNAILKQNVLRFHFYSKVYTISV